MVTRVLVVDDSLTIRRVVSAVLERHGFEAVHAADGQAALDALLQAADRPMGPNGESVEPHYRLRATPAESSVQAAGSSERPPPPRVGKIDVVLVDFVMPRMNGFQLCRAIRQHEAIRATPVVLMSAKSDRIREHFVQQTGAIDAITKPFDARALVAVIENALRRSERWRGRGELATLETLEEIERSESTPPPVGEGAPTGLSGDLAIIPIGAILQLLQMEGQSGILRIADARTEVNVVLRSGLIDLVHAKAAGAEFRLGRYFVEHGLVTPAEIDELLGDPARNDPAAWPRKLVGQRLVEAGRVTPEQLRDALARQSSELVYEVLRWPRGRFEFRRDPPPSPLAVAARLALPVAAVVMEGFRRVDEWRLIESGLGSFESVLLADAVVIDAAEIERLAKPEQRLLSMVDGERTVRDIIEESHMSSFDACKILFQLLEARLVRRRPR